MRDKSQPRGASRYISTLHRQNDFNLPTPPSPIKAISQPLPRRPQRLPPDPLIRLLHQPHHPRLQPSPLQDPLPIRHLPHNPGDIVAAHGQDTLSPLPLLAHNLRQLLDQLPPLLLDDPPRVLLPEAGAPVRGTPPEMAGAHLGGVLVKGGLRGGEVVEQLLEGGDVGVVVLVGDVAGLEVGEEVGEAGGDGGGEKGGRVGGEEVGEGGEEEAGDLFFGGDAQEGGEQGKDVVVPAERGR